MFLFLHRCVNQFSGIQVKEFSRTDPLLGFETESFILRHFEIAENKKKFPEARNVISCMVLNLSVSVCQDTGKRYN